MSGERKSEVGSRRIVCLHPREVVDSGCRKSASKSGQVARTEPHLAEGRVDVGINFGIRHGYGEVNVIARLRHIVVSPVLGGGHLVVAAKSSPLLARTVAPLGGCECIFCGGIERLRNGIVET